MLVCGVCLGLFCGYWEGYAYGGECSAAWALSLLAFGLVVHVEASYVAPRVSGRVAALVASILSIEREMSVMRPAKSRAVVGLESALNSAEFLPSVHSSSSSIALGLSGSVVWGLW